jgi:hypothetical protein
VSGTQPGVVNHYEVLGVDPTSGVDEIRRAYHGEARRWHPDGFLGRSNSDLAKAEEAMRAVNEAWRVLGDIERRASFDRLRSRTTRPAGVSTDGITVDSGVIRIDPRLLDPEFLATRRRHQEAEIATAQAVVLRTAPWLALGGLLIAIFIFTAFARSPEAPPPTTVPGPALGVEAGACVRIATGPSLVPVPCNGGSLYDGRVIGARLEDGKCPTGTIREVPLAPNKIACLGS